MVRLPAAFSIRNISASACCSRFQALITKTFSSEANIFRPCEICSFISSFDSVGRWAHISNTEQYVRVLIFTWFSAMHTPSLLSLSSCHTKLDPPDQWGFKPVCHVITSNESAKGACEKQVLHILHSNLLHILHSNLKRCSPHV